MIVFSRGDSRGALLVGIKEYQNKGWNLRGPENDVLTMQQLLLRYGVDNFLVLRNEEATKTNILNSLLWLKQFNKRYSYISSHGSRIPIASKNDIEWTEVVIAYDHSWGDPLIDDDLFNAFASFRGGVTYATFDCCHAEGAARNLSPLIIAKSVVCPGKIKLTRAICRYRGVTDNVIGLYACGTEETAGETIIEGRWQGVFTHALGQVLQNPVSLSSLATKLKEIIQKYTNQNPIIDPKLPKIAFC